MKRQVRALLHTAGEQQTLQEVTAKAVAKEELDPRVRRQMQQFSFCAQTNVGFLHHVDDVGATGPGEGLDSFSKMG